MPGFIVRTVVTAIALAVAAWLLPGLGWDPPDYGLGAQGNEVVAVLLTAAVLGLFNAVIRPILVLLTVPITCLTLGLFILVVNGVVLFLVQFVPFLGFQVTDLIQAILGALVVSVVSFVLSMVVR